MLYEMEYFSQHENRCSGKQIGDIITRLEKNLGLLLTNPYYSLEHTKVTVVLPSDYLLH